MSNASKQEFIKEIDGSMDRAISAVEKAAAAQEFAEKRMEESLKLIEEFYEQYPDSTELEDKFLPKLQELENQIKS